MKKIVEKNVIKFYEIVIHFDNHKRLKCYVENPEKMLIELTDKINRGLLNPEVRFVYVGGLVIDSQSFRYASVK